MTNSSFNDVVGNVHASERVAQLRAAGESASRRGDHSAAARYYTRALDELGGAPELVRLLDEALDAADAAEDRFHALCAEREAHQAGRPGAVV